MLISILAVLLLGVVAALGYFQGAVRLLVSLFGLFLGAMLAFPLSSTMKPVVNLLGVKHPVWSWVWPPIFVFFIVYLVFLGLSFFVHRKLELHYKYGTDDVSMFRWERLNKRLGVCLGLFMGGVWLYLISLVIHVAGYLSVQVASDSTSSSLIRYLSQAKQELRDVGLEKSVAALDPMPPNYYQAADILGLIYQNPILLNRLSQYPPFLTLGERTEFQEIANDKDYNNLLLTKADVTEIVSNPKTQAIIYSQEIVQELLKQDLPDLRQYLQTGKSPKYDDEKILGRWKIDLYSTVAQERRKHPNLSASDMTRLKKTLNDVLPGVTFTATTDNKVTRKVQPTESAQPAVVAPTPVQNPNVSPGMSPEMAQRYGLTRPPGSNPATPPPPVQPPPNAPPPLVVAGQGTWQREGDKYHLSLQDDKGRPLKEVAIADDERLTVQTLLITLVFVKAE